MVIEGLFNILHLLAEALWFCFGGDDAAGDVGGVGFGADGVALAEHLLGEEVEGASVGLPGGEAGAELGDVALEAAEFLGDVGAVGEEGEFAGEAFVVVGVGGVERREAGAHGLPVAGGDGGGEFADGGDFFAEAGQQAGQFAGEVGASRVRMASSERTAAREALSTASASGVSATALSRAVVA